MTAVAVSRVAADPHDVLLGVPTNVWIGTLGSISASGLFFTVSETLRWFFEKTVTYNYERLRFYEETVGIREYFSQKGADDANKDYRSAIASATRRVWAFGISNGEFLTEHLQEIINNKKRQPSLDVCICFVDPCTTVTINGIGELSQIFFYDMTRDSLFAADNTVRVKQSLDYTKDRILSSGVKIEIRLLSVAGYVSAMVVDDIIYFFPFTAISKDNTRTPYLKVAVLSKMGEPFFAFLKNIKDHPKLSRPLDMEAV